MSGCLWIVCEGERDGKQGEEDRATKEGDRERGDACADSEIIHE